MSQILWSFSGTARGFSQNLFLCASNRKIRLHSGLYVQLRKYSELNMSIKDVEGKNWFCVAFKIWSDKPVIVNIYGIKCFSIICLHIIISYYILIFDKLFIKWIKYTCLRWLVIEMQFKQGRWDLQWPLEARRRNSTEIGLKVFFDHFLLKGPLQSTLEGCFCQNYLCKINKTEFLSNKEWISVTTATSSSWFVVILVVSLKKERKSSKTFFSFVFSCQLQQKKDHFLHCFCAACSVQRHKHTHVVASVDNKTMNASEKRKIQEKRLKSGTSWGVWHSKTHLKAAEERPNCFILSTHVG